MFDLVELFLPPEQTGLECVTMCDPHAVDGGPNRVFFVPGDTVGAALNAEPWLQFFHDGGKEPHIFFFIFFAREEEGVESTCPNKYFFPWPCRSIIYFIFWDLASPVMNCFIFTV